MSSPPIGTPPLVVAVGGLPGSGKTTLGRQLAIALRAALLDQDTLTNPLMAQLAALAGAGDDLDHPALRGPVRTARYECLRDTAADVVGAGCSVVLVAPFTAELGDPVAWQAFSAPLTAALGAASTKAPVGLKVPAAAFAGRRPLLVEVVVDPELALARRAGRGLPRDRRFAVPTPPTGATTADLRADGAADPIAEAARLAGVIREFDCSG